MENQVTKAVTLRTRTRRGEEMIRADDVGELAVNMMLTGANPVAKQVDVEREQAMDAMEEIGRTAYAVAKRLSDQRTELTANVKRVVGDVRDASEKLSQGLARVEKAANFDRLERYVTLLERAATAMKALEELERTGRLEKIAGALR